LNKTPPTIEQPPLKGDDPKKVREKNIEKFKSVYDILMLND